MHDEDDAPQPLGTRHRQTMIRGLAAQGANVETFQRVLEQRLADVPANSPESLLVWNSAYLDHLPPLSALFVGAATPFGQWEIIDFLAACYPTVGESMTHIGQHMRLVNPTVTFVVDQGTEASLPFVEFRHTHNHRNDYSDEYCIGIFLNHHRHQSNHPIALAAAHVVRARPLDPELRAKVRQFLGCEPTYGAPHARLVFTREAWNAPLLAANPRLQATLEAHANAMHREQVAAHGLEARVRGVVAQLLRAGEPRLDQVAKRLGMTARTLQRRLQAETSGFATLVDQARLDLAKRYLGDASLSVSEVSFALGYSEPSAFARAFKRLAGVTPVEFRDRLQAGSTLADQ